MGITQYTTSSGSGGGAGIPTVTAGIPTTSSMPLSWTAVSGATSYDIWDTTGSTRVFAATTSATSYTVTGLSTTTSYTFEVFAKNAAGTVIASTSSSSLPGLLKMTVWEGSQDFSSSLNNDGTDEANSIKKLLSGDNT